MEQSVKDAIEDKNAAKKEFNDLVLDKNSPRKVARNLKESNTQREAKFDQSAFMELDSDDCLHLLAPFLAFEKMKCSKKKGNVCVAFAVNENILYLAANR